MTDVLSYAWTHSCRGINKFNNNIVNQIYTGEWKKTDPISDAECSYDITLKASYVPHPPYPFPPPLYNYVCKDLSFTKHNTVD